MADSNRRLVLSFLVLAVGAAWAGQASAGVGLCDDQWPAWSPDGAQVVFSSTRTGDHEIFVRSLAGGEARQLTSTPGRDAHPSFSPDGRQIAFQSPRGDGHTNLYVMDRDGSGARRVTSHEGFAGMPVWSPDGRRLAYQWRSESAGARWQLMMLTLATGAVEPLTDASANDQVVNWSPDGTRLVFHSDRTGRNQIYVWSDGVVTRVADTPFDDRSASWSPDGRLLAFVSRHGDDAGGVYIMAADGAHRRRVGDVGVEHTLPFFSPDGRRLLITPTTASGTEIWTLDVATGRATRVSGCATVTARASAGVPWR